MNRDLSIPPGLVLNASLVVQCVMLLLMLILSPPGPPFFAKFFALKRVKAQRSVRTRLWSGASLNDLFAVCCQGAAKVTGGNAFASGMREFQNCSERRISDVGTFNGRRDAFAVGEFSTGDG